MKNCLLMIIVAIIVLFPGCKPSREKSIQQIMGMEERLSSSRSITFDKAKADSLLVLYGKFIQRFPDDSLSPKFLFHSARLAMTLGDGPKALEQLDHLMSAYPENPKAQVCMFFKGYIYENLIHDLDKAKEIYLLFVEKYPDSEFARDARLAVQNLGKSPDQMIREFEAKQKADSARRADSVKLANRKHRK